MAAGNTKPKKVLKRQTQTYVEIHDKPIYTIIL